MNAGPKMIYKERAEEADARWRGICGEGGIDFNFRKSITIIIIIST